MKRVKMMLLSLLVLGVVGGTMAFKARFNTDMCITPARVVGGNFTCAAAGGGNLTCPNLILALTTRALQDFNKWCTTPAPVNLECAATLTCGITVRSLEGDGGGE